MYNTKRKLIELAFETAKKELPRGSKSSVAAYLSMYFEEKFGYSKDERTFVRYYKKLIEEKSDYNIDDIMLDQLSCYMGYKDYKDFCENYKTEPFVKNFGSVKVAISEDKDTNPLSDTLSKIMINITNSPVFSIPEFITKNQNSLGIVGILLLAGFIWTKMDQISVNSENKIDRKNPISQISKDNKNTDKITIPQQIIYIPREQKEEKIIIEPKRKECMYWKNDHYESAFCNEKIPGADLIALNEESLILLKKINQPDTLTLENSIGKVWYDKSNNIVEFFTHFGIHPVNGKTLKPVTEGIIEKYITKIQ